MDQFISLELVTIFLNFPLQTVRLSKTSLKR